MNVKKFAQDKAKKMKYEKYLKQNKENLFSVDDSKFKQFSVDLHKLSMDQDYPNRNIIKEEISVFLENQSQNGKTFNSGERMLQVELRKFVRRLDENDGGLREFLEEELEEGEEIKAEEVKKLVGALVKKLNTQSTRSSLKSRKAPSQQQSIKTSQSFQNNSSKIFSSQSITPYLCKQIESMQQKLCSLTEENSQYKEFKNIEKSQKEYIRHTLENVYKKQMEQVYQLEQLANLAG